MMKTITILTALCFIVYDSTGQTKFVDFESAMENPEAVIELDLSNSEMDSIPFSLLQFKNLESLDLSGLHLNEIPEEVGLLPNLKYLDLSGNDMKNLPITLAKAGALVEVHLDDEENLDVENAVHLLAGLSSIRTLTLRHDSLRTLPEELSIMRNLEELNIGGNLITELPEELSQLQSLRRLYLDDEPELNFNQAFVVIQKLSGLEELHLEGNQLSHIPESILKMRNLRLLFLDGSFNNSKRTDVPVIMIEGKEPELQNRSLVNQHLERTGLRFRF